MELKCWTGNPETGQVKNIEQQNVTFKCRTNFLRFSLNSSIGTCCLSLVLPNKAASLAPKKIVVAIGGLVESWKWSHPYNYTLRTQD